LWVKPRPRNDVAGIDQSYQKFWKKNCPSFQKVAQKVSKLKKKCQNILNEAQIESPDYLHQTTFETLKYLQQALF
jgi:hypothetical protein